MTEIFPPFGSVPLARCFFLHPKPLQQVQLPLRLDVPANEFLSLVLLFIFFPSLSSVCAIIWLRIFVRNLTFLRKKKKESERNGIFPLSIEQSRRCFRRRHFWVSRWGSEKPRQHLSPSQTTTFFSFNQKRWLAAICNERNQKQPE